MVAAGEPGFRRRPPAMMTTMSRRATAFLLAGAPGNGATAACISAAEGAAQTVACMERCKVSGWDVLVPYVFVDSCDSRCGHSCSEAEACCLCWLLLLLHYLRAADSLV